MIPPMSVCVCSGCNKISIHENKNQKCKECGSIILEQVEIKTFNDCKQCGTEIAIGKKFCNHCLDQLKKFKERKVRNV